MLHADIYFTKSDHLVRIMTGLHLLEKEEILCCRYIEDSAHTVLPDSASILEMQICGKRIAFDLRDASALNQSKLWDYLSSVDAYFERSHKDWTCTAELHDQAHKIFPFGFNYYVTYPGNPAYVPTASKNMIKNIIRDSLNNSRYTRVDAFESKA